MRYRTDVGAAVRVEVARCEIALAQARIGVRRRQRAVDRLREDLRSDRVRDEIGAAVPGHFGGDEIVPARVAVVRVLRETAYCALREDVDARRAGGDVETAVAGQVAEGQAQGAGWGGDRRGEGR